MRFAVLASGSAGNSAFLATSTTRILIDAGLSVKGLSTRLAAIGERLEDIDAIVVSHEHGDHVAGVARLVRAGIKRGRAIPVYMTRLTEPMIDWQGLECPPVNFFNAGSSFSVGDIGVSSFSVRHDATDPCAFAFQAEGVKIGVATDLGFVHDNLRARFRGCDVVMIESNYDEEMLRNCTTRPLAVIERIASANGHLSNVDTCEYISKDMPESVRKLVLGHLSTDNNRPELVAEAALDALGRRDLYPQLILASQDRATEVIKL